MVDVAALRMAMHRTMNLMAAPVDPAFAFLAGQVPDHGDEGGIDDRAALDHEDFARFDRSLRDEPGPGDRTSPKRDGRRQMGEGSALRYLSIAARAGPSFSTASSPAFITASIILGPSRDR